MESTIRAIGYSNSYQTLTVNESIGGSLVVHLWGGAGGGGASDGGGRGGDGGGGGYVRLSFSVSLGDVVGIAVGGAGGKGYTSSGGGGGFAGGSYINTGISYSGAVGGNAGGRGSSGGGGGAGGGTVLTLNGTVIAVAGGGGGGGGAGQYSYIDECSAPGQNFHSVSATSGSAGQNFGGDGGGGGGGGGGGQGGQGGSVRGGEQTAYAGAYGTNFLDSGYIGTVEEPSGTTPGGANAPYRTSVAGVGGLGAIPGVRNATNGNNGYAVIELNVNGTFVNDSGVWKPVQKFYVKQADTWKTVKGMYINNNGVWESVLGNPGNVPAFNSLSTNFGVSYRPYGSS